MVKRAAARPQWQGQQVNHSFYMLQMVVAVAELVLRFQNLLNWRFSDYKVRANRSLMLYCSSALCREYPPAGSATTTTVYNT